MPSHKRMGNSAILWASTILFTLFAVQIAYQIYLVYRNHVEVDANLDAELADAVFTVRPR